MPRGLWWGFEPLPAEAPGREWSSKGSSGPARYGRGHLRAGLTPTGGQESVDVGAYLGLAGERLGDEGEAEREMRMLVYPEAGLGGGGVTEETKGLDFSPDWGLWAWILVSWVGL